MPDPHQPANADPNPNHPPRAAPSNRVLADRLGKAEDRAHFNEHTIDQLSEQLIKAYRAIEKLNARIDHLEHRLKGVEHTAGSYFNTDPNERPPHSAPKPEADTPAPPSKTSEPPRA